MNITPSTILIAFWYIIFTAGMTVEAKNIFNGLSMKKDKKKYLWHVIEYSLFNSTMFYVFICTDLNKYGSWALKWIGMGVILAAAYLIIGLVYGKMLMKTVIEQFSGKRSDFGRILPVGPVGLLAKLKLTKPFEEISQEELKAIIFSWKARIEVDWPVILTTNTILPNLERRQKV